MNQRTRYTWISLGLNLALGILISLPLLVLMKEGDALGYLVGVIFFMPISLLVQLIVGIIFIRSSKRKIMGQAMLLAVGIILLVGLSVCGNIWFGFLF
jgi:hypothetical protein